MEIIVPIVSGVVLIVGLVALFLSATVWRAGQIVVVAFLMIGTVAFFYLSARTLKTHAAWRAQVNNYEKKIADLEQQNKAMMEGGALPDGTTTAGMRTTEAELARLRTVPGGRAWRGGIPSPLQPDGTLTVTFQNSSPPEIKSNDIVYAIANISSGQGQYAGRFLVTAMADRQVTLSPMAGASDTQLERLAQPSGQWSLYDSMPADTQMLFADLTADQLKQLMPDTSETEYLRDQKPFNAGDPEDRAWVKVKFVKPYETAVDQIKFLKSHQLQIGSETVAYSAGQTAMVDPKTSADLVAQKIAEPTKVSIPEGATAVFDPKTAGELVKGGQAQEVEKIYMRPLRDYATLLSDLQNARRVYQSDVARLSKETTTFVGVEKQISSDIAQREKQIGLFQNDLSHLKAELEALTGFVGQLTTRYTDTVKQLNATYNRNLRMAAELKTLSASAIEEVNQRAGSPEVSVRETEATVQ